MVAALEDLMMEKRGTPLRRKTEDPEGPYTNLLDQNSWKEVMNFFFSFEYQNNKVLLHRIASSRDIVTGQLLERSCCYCTCRVSSAFPYSPSNTHTQVRASFGSSSNSGFPHPPYQPPPPTPWCSTTPLPKEGHAWEEGRK